MIEMVRIYLNLPAREKKCGMELFQAHRRQLKNLHVKGVTGGFGVNNVVTPAVTSVTLLLTEG